MRKRERDALQRRLLQQRRLLLKEVADTEADLEALESDRESELEEAALDERLTRLLDRLDFRAKAEVEEIDAALVRLADGRYGACLGCGKAIAGARLNALPATPYCIACATLAERGQLTGAAAEEAEPPPRATLPEDYALLTDSELQAAVREHLAADGRLDLEEIRVICRHGVVYLDGQVPSAAEHQILLHTVTDVMGLTEVTDRVRVEQSGWQREDRMREEASEPPLPWQEKAGSEDVTEVTEEGADFEAPSKPLPDEE
jgi:RNA polymerase-binding transcription factor